MTEREPQATEIVARLEMVRENLRQATEEAGRTPDSVTLIAVSKTFDAPAIRPVLEANQRIFGENRVQEAEGKWPDLKSDYPDVELHLIGPLQSNKAKQAIALFDVIQTIDRPKIARALAREVQAQGRSPKFYVQINTGEEPQKAGIPPGEADRFIKDCRDTYGLSVDGLMCIPPVGETPGLHFALLAKIAERNGIEVLSMGMSADYETAIAFGASHVRVGSAIFGSRPPLGSVPA